MADANIRAVITVKDEASSALKKFGDNSSSVGDKIASVAKVASVALLAAGAAAVAFGVSSVKAFEESQNMIAQTNAVLKSTGGIAGVTADQVDKLSKSLQKQTKFSDEDVRSVENLLLTFTSITKDIFPDATKTVLDMATALGEDTKSASIQLGKALQDPVLGITALRRVGVNFSDAQKDVIKNLVETGQKAKAQQLILKELHTEFGGSAEAAGNTFAGSLEKLKNQFNDIQEVIGGTIVKYLTPLVTKAAEVIMAIDWDRVIRRTVHALKEMQYAVQAFFGAGFGGQGVTEFSGFFNIVERGGVIAKQVFDYLEPKVVALWHSLDTKLIPALSRLGHVLEPLLPIMGKLFVVEVGLAIDYLNLLARYISAVINIVLDIPKAVETAFNFVVAKLIWWKDNWAEVTGEIIGFVATLPIKLEALMILAVIKMVQAAISVRWSDVFSGIWQGMQAVWDNVTGIVVRAWQFIHDLRWGDLFMGIGKSIGNAVLDLVEGALKGAVKGLPGNLESKIHIPRFDKGGVVPGATGAPLLAVVHGGERVIPNSGGKPAGGSVNISVNVGVFAGTQMELRKLATTLQSAYQDAQSMGTA